MGYLTTVRQTGDTGSALTAAETTINGEGDPTAVVHAHRARDSFERNSVRVQIESDGVLSDTIEADEENGTYTFDLRDDVGRALALALTAHYADRDGEADGRVKA